MRASIRKKSMSGGTSIRKNQCLVVLQLSKYYLILKIEEHTKESLTIRDYCFNRLIEF